MTASAFSAVFSDWKVIKTRACVQVVFELPIEKADEAYQALGGMPIAANEVWCAVARLTDKAPRRESVTASAGADKPPKPPAQVAGYLCTLPSFHKFLEEKFPNEWQNNGIRHGARGGNEHIAANCIYDICTVTSRAQLTADNTEWHALQLAFKLWQNYPELESA